MLSIEECKKYLEDKTFSDEDILEIRDNLYGLAELALENYIESKKYEKKKT